MTRESVPLRDAASYLIDECRMVLPGIQTLFGFQLIAVFNERFAVELSHAEQRVHFVSLALVAIAIAIIMTPAALHRCLRVREVTESFVVVSTRLLLTSMFPLAVALVLEFYLIARMVIGHGIAPVLAALLMLVFVILWVFLPNSERLQRLLAR